MNSVRSQASVFHMSGVSVSATVLTLLTLFFILLANPAFAQIPTPSILYNFQGPPSDIEVPSGALAQGRDANLYGTAYEAGANHEGGVYMLTPAGLTFI